MSIRRFSVRVLAVFAALASSAAALADRADIVFWNFNTDSTLPTTGTGTLTLINGVTGTFNAGSPNDLAIPNRAYNTTNYPAQGTGSGTSGVQFAASTVGFEQVIFKFDQRHSNTSSRYVQVIYSINGTTFQDAPNGLFMAVDGDTWHTDRTIDFTNVAGVNNNPNFKVRVVSVFDPNLVNAYSASRPASTYAGGTLRPDLVSISGEALVPTPPTGSPLASPSIVCAGSTVDLSVAAGIGQNPPSTGITVTANLSPIGGSAAEPMLTFDDALFFLDDVVVPFNTTPGIKSIVFTVRDAQDRTSTTNALVSVGDCSQSSNSTVVISTVYGGGGGSGAPLNADFIELFNRGCDTVSLDGWSVQYAGANATTNQFDGRQQVNLFGSILPGQYLLVQTKRVNELDEGLPLPTPDFIAFPADPMGTPVPPETIDGFGMNNSSGRVALVSSTTPLFANCGSSTIEDLVGYGLPAQCFEGAGPTNDLGTSTAAVRKSNGCQDTSQTFNDFDVVIVPDPRNSASPLNPCGGPCAPTCTLDYNLDTVVNPDDLGDFITDYYTSPAIAGPGGYAIPCPENAFPYDAGYKTGFVVGGGGQCNEPFPDNLGDWITQYYGDGTCG
ncbi:MAG: lamin tail domain-containing protein [Phycisphaerales bacterium]